MSMLESLAKEHSLLGGLVDRLEEGLREGPERAPGEVRQALLVLFQALEKHEEIEDLVFGRPAYAPKGEARRILAEVERQHERIARILGEIDGLLRLGGRCSFGTLDGLVRDLAGKLRRHFAAEEEGLWPRYRRTRRPPADRALDRRAREQVLELERRIDGMHKAMGLYMTGRR